MLIKINLHVLSHNNSKFVCKLVYSVVRNLEQACTILPTTLYKYFENVHNVVYKVVQDCTQGWTCRYRLNVCVYTAYTFKYTNHCFADIAFLLLSYILSCWSAVQLVYCPAGMLSYRSTVLLVRIPTSLLSCWLAVLQVYCPPGLHSY